MNKCENKNILYIGNFLLPDGDAASHRVLGNAKALREIGYKVYLLGCRKNEMRPLMGTLNSYTGFSCYFFNKPTSVLSWYNYLCSIGWYVSLIESVKPRAIIVYNYPAIALERLRKYCNKHSIDLYSDCTEWFEPQGNLIYKKIKQLDTNYRMKVIQPKLTGIIAISCFLQNYYKDKGCKTICVPPLVDKKDIKWDNLLDTDETQKVIHLCYVGNPGTGKKDKLDLVISALRNILLQHSEIQFKFTIVGIHKEEYLKNFSSYDSICESFLEFKGKIPNTEALSLIKKSDYTIFLRDQNLVSTAGFPTKFSESIACGTPVLTNDTSDIKKYIKEGVTGYLLDASSNEKLYSSLYSILSLDKKEIFRMKKECLQDTSFDYHSFIFEFKKIFS